MTHKRKPGGQPGNQNARTHGFYSKVLTPQLQALLLPAKQLDGIDQELALARAKVNSIAVNDPRNYAVLFGLGNRGPSRWNEAKAWQTYFAALFTGS